MHYLVKAVAILLVYNALLPTNLQAQFQLNLTGTYLAPIQSGHSFNNGPWGPKVTLRYFTNPHLAIGLNVRYSAASSSSEFPSQSLSAKNKITDITATGQVEYFCTTSALQPYIGLEAGVIRNGFKNETTGALNSTLAVNEYYFVVYPKLGLQYNIIPAFGVNLEAAYQLAPAGLVRLNSGLLLGGGIFFKFGHRLGSVSR